MDMQPGLQIDFNAITRLFSDAQQEDHEFLFEYETYHLLADSGAEALPRWPNPWWEGGTPAACTIRRWKS